MSVESRLVNRGVWVPGMDLPSADADSLVYRCPTCGHTYRQREPMEPMCTGPNWTDDHEPAVMEFLP